ncbi:MAG: metallophosphoesterase, partial [Candidatus Thorarchaeota archaeon]
MGRTVSTFVLLSLLCSPLIAIAIAPVNVSSTSFVISDSSDFIRGPTVNLVSNDTASIFWRTATSENSIVHFGKNTSLLESVTNATTVTDHLIRLDGLDMDTKYYYTVESGIVESEMYSFHTAPADGEEFRLVIAGDNRPGSSEHPTQPEIFSELAERIIEEEPHLVVLTGDFVYSVTTSDSANLNTWKLFTDITDHIGHYAPVIGIVGNHDTGVSYGEYQIQYYLDAFINTGENTTYFSFDYAGVHFTILDSELEDLEGHIVGTQYDWLVQDLDANPEKMKFVFAHRPLYPVTHVGSALDIDTDERDGLQELFEEKNVTLFAVGHDHTYDRVTVNGVVHIITGGLGAPLYNSPWSTGLYHYMLSAVSAHAVNFSAITPDGTLFDQYNLPYDGPIEIVDRVIANTSSKPIGTVPFILFSEDPVTRYFSWDGASNTTEISGLPGPEGEHILDVYAENSEGIWSSA